MTLAVHNMTVDEIQEILIKIHRRFSKSTRRSSASSQMCIMWSTSNPPDVLENTPALDAIEKAINYGFYEMEALEVYDMEIKDAAKYIHKLINIG